MSRQRSPGYPSAPLQVALMQAEKIYSQNRTNAIDREAAAKSMGYGGSSGASDKTIANLAHYGLLDKAGKGEVRISQLAVDILRPENEASRAEALQTAAFNPQLFAILRERFPDGHFSDAALKNALSRMGFQEVAIQPASRAYSETCQFLQQENAYESYDSPFPSALESSPPDQREKGYGVMDHMQPMSAGEAPPSRRVPPNLLMIDAEANEQERTVYCEEGAPGQYLKLVASGDLDDYLLEAIEDFVKRQRKRLARKAGSPENTSTAATGEEVGAENH
ncbi:hypothetical protein PZ895_12240 [Mesorhizobium sp. YIM 152430]|uniref:hypothetical protein n=1 Tax=Mesorhizobium sp. YIM 152430 TaxID=3031761 RepID=UPI0023DC8FCB|nr:hypothetical protein [Mesorhizobium sp. YIM 152430]MDF1600529.1 hypothetical protein [Mesorhizobium sp. YIM 152430]